MEDTPQPVKNLQLRLWLEKKPGERLLQFLQDNDVMFKAIIKQKKTWELPTIRWKNTGNNRKA